jgi:hypothetical protein
MTELTEDQFKLLDSLVKQGVFLILFPDLQETDLPEVKENHEKMYNQLETLKTLGLLETVTDKFTQTLEEIKKEGLRPFTAYLLTEVAIRMFLPGNGAAN